MFVLTSILTFIICYIVSRLSVFYINIWCLAIFLVTLITIAYAAGRQNVEIKLVAAKKAKYRASGDLKLT